MSVRERFEAIFRAEGVTVPETADFKLLASGIYANMKVRTAFHWFQRKEKVDPWYVAGFMEPLPPVDVVLFCPKCGMQHIDAPGIRSELGGAMLVHDWTNPPHRTHLCKPEDGGCGFTWRPADVPTNGVAAIQSKGANDGMYTGGQVPAQSWRCFHCAETFTVASEAALHFGSTIFAEPMCRIDQQKYREIELLLQRYREEDTDLHREIHHLRSKHRTDLQREEEKGYARGLDDGKHLATPSRAVAHIKWLQGTLREAGYCIDGGKCHRGCGKDPKAKCSRQDGCVPLTGSGLDDNWTLSETE